MRRFREPIYEQIALVLDTYLRPGLSAHDKAELLRTVVDTVQTHVGNSLLHNLHRTRAYHGTAGAMGDHELLESGSVSKLIRETTGLASELVQPIERQGRRSLGTRLRGR